MYSYLKLTISCVYLFLTPNSRSVFYAGVSLNIRSFLFILIFKKKEIKTQKSRVRILTF